MVEQRNQPGSKRWRHATAKPWSSAAPATRTFIRDGPRKPCHAANDASPESRMMRKYPVRFGGGPMEKCHIRLLRCNWIGKLASGLPDPDVVVIDEAGRKVAQLRVEHTPEGVRK